MKKISFKTIYLILVISMGLIGLGVGSTFAMFTASESIDNPISFTAGMIESENDIFETIEITLSSGETKSTNVSVNNNTSYSLNYVMWYIDEGYDIDFGVERTDGGVYQNVIGANEVHNYEVSIVNNSTDTVKIIIGVASNKGNVVLGNNMVILDNQKLKLNMAHYIANLYNSTSSKTSVLNNNITYYYDTEHNLMQDVGGNIRYYGKSPNNYIYFNCDDYSNQTSDTCELWRIIGVFDGKLKIIRNSIIGTYSWDTSDSTINSGSGVNEWSQADLMKLLNPGYESESVGGSLYYNSKSGTCYSGSKNTTKECDFTSTGIKNDETRNKIATVTYSTGGNSYSNYNIYSNQWYSKERGTTVISSPSDGITRQTTWEGKIALAYPSDYGYATDFTKCSNTLYKYNTSDDSSACRSNDWMYPILGTGSYGWLMAPGSGSAYGVWYVGSAGRVDNIYGAFIAVGGAPVLYLSSDEILESGTGLSSDAYKLG